jgi:signal transduction histidine kinase
MENEDPLIMGDKARLENVLLNFLSNAIKFSPPGSRVVMKIRCCEAEMTLGRFPSEMTSGVTSIVASGFNSLVTSPLMSRTPSAEHLPMLEAARNQILNSLNLGIPGGKHRRHGRGDGSTDSADGTGTPVDASGFNSSRGGGAGGGPGGGVNAASMQAALTSAAEIYSDGAGDDKGKFLTPTVLSAAASKKAAVKRILRVRVVVSDQGLGISGQDMQSLFTPFGQIHPGDLQVLLPTTRVFIWKTK